MKVLVAGGTGLVGSAITRQLLDKGHEVTILSRSKSSKHRVDSRARWVKGNVTEPATLAPALAGFEVVVDAVQFPNSPVENPKKGYTFERIDFGGTRNLIDAAVAASIGQYIDISGMGAAADAPYHWQRFKWQEEQHLIASGLTYTAFRPTWIFAPDDVSLNRFLNFARFLPFIPVIGDGKTHTNILYIGDLAAHVAAATGNPAAYGRIFEIGGPQVLTMDQIIRTALRVSGKKRALIHQPKPLMKFIAGILQHLPGRPLTPDAIDFVTMDGDANTAALEETFGLPPTPLADGLATYLAPR
jgi:uncharacterized protein YbjT (DUF2867 family)